MNKTMRNLIKNCIILVVWLCLWQIASVITGLEFLFASPVSVFKEFCVLIRTQEFYGIILHSFIRITCGYIGSFVIAVILGGVAGKYSLVRDFLAPAMHLMKSLPVAACIIMILMWFGSENVSLIVGGMVVIPIIYTAVVQGVANMDQGMIEMAELFRMSWIKKVRYIYFPQVYPFAESSCKVALGMCWKAGVSAEVIGLATDSIGVQMYYAKLYLLSANLFVWSIMVIILSVVFEKSFLLLMRCVRELLAH